MFDAFEFDVTFFTALGAIVAWGRLGAQGIRVYALSRLVESIVAEQRIRIILEFLVFVTIGALVGVVVVEPKTGVQAIAAGLGWTGLLARADRRAS